jgi:hypothetical protein
VRSPRLKRQIKGAEQGTRKKTVSAPPRSWGHFFETKTSQQIDGPVKGRRRAVWRLRVWNV